MVDTKMFQRCKGLVSIGSLLGMGSDDGGGGYGMC